VLKVNIDYTIYKYYKISFNDKVNNREFKKDKFSNQDIIIFFSSEL